MENDKMIYTYTEAKQNALLAYENIQKNNKSEYDMFINKMALKEE